MTVSFQDNYTLPNGAKSLKNARVLHSGNATAMSLVTASDEVSEYPASSVEGWDTVDRWKPFSNQIASPTDFSTSDWTLINATVGSDGQTIDEGTAVGVSHGVRQSVTYTAGEWVIGVRVQRGTLGAIRVQASDGTNVVLGNINLDRETVHSGTSGSDWSVIPLGSDIYEIRGRMSRLAGTGNLNIYGLDEGISTTLYTGTNRTFKLLRVVVHESEATLDLTPFDSTAEADCFAIAAHNLGTGGGRVTFEYDRGTNNLLQYTQQLDTGWTDVRVTPSVGAALAPDDRLDATGFLETVGTSTSHYTQDTVSVTSGSTYIFSCYCKLVGAERQFWLRPASTGAPGSVIFDLADAANTATSGTIDDYGQYALDNDWHFVWLKMTATATGSMLVRFQFRNSGENYDSDGTDGFYIWGADFYESDKLLPYAPVLATTANSIAKLNIETKELTDNSPIMHVFTPFASGQYRFTVDSCVLPEIGVVKVGSALQFQRSFYAGYKPTYMNRETSIIGNLSGSGEFLGGSKKRTILNGSYPWMDLTFDWVKENLAGRTGLINSVEDKPCFVAWRPGEEEDVDYVMRVSTQPPAAQGKVNLFSFSMSGEVHSYE